MPDDPQSARTSETPEPTRWPWWLLAAAACWVVLIRVPLVLNAAQHLDSDLAVDGLTLLDAVHGHWRWHYPGTPYIGIGPVLLSMPAALLGGVTPATLVSGGTLAYLGLLVGSFLLAWWGFGPRVAAWSLVPLTFASNGAVWLSGRVTGGHLVAAAWHAGAFALFVWAWRKGDRWSALVLGLWCGIGLYLDSMFIVTLAGLVVAALGGWLASGAKGRGTVLALVFGVGFLGGVWPREVGARLDPYSCYDEQFSLAGGPGVLAGHADLLFRECLPRLVAGHKLLGLETDPEPASLNGPGPVYVGPRTEPVTVWSVGAAGLSLSLSGIATVVLLGAVFRAPDRAARLAVAGLVVASAATVAGFIANRNIFNSDNYRYLVGLLVPWALGFGLLLDQLTRRGWGGRLGAAALAIVFAIVMTADLAHWYARFGWVDHACRPIRRPVDDPVLTWLTWRQDVIWIEGGYWDVYRLCFLSGSMRGAPLPVFPNRFPEWTPSPGCRRALVVRPTPDGEVLRARALRAGKQPAFQSRGTTVYVLP